MRFLLLAPKFLSSIKIGFRIRFFVWYLAEQSANNTRNLLIHRNFVAFGRNQDYLSNYFAVYLQKPKSETGKR